MIYLSGAAIQTDVILFWPPFIEQFPKDLKAAKNLDISKNYFKTHLFNMALVVHPLNIFSLLISLF